MVADGSTRRLTGQTEGDFRCSRQPSPRPCSGWAPWASPAGGGAPKQTAKANHHLPTAAGTIVAISDTQMTIERLHRDKKNKSAAPVKEDIVFKLDKNTKVYRSDGKTPAGLDALTKGERVRVAYTTEVKDPKAPSASDPKLAKRIVIVPDVRTGTLVSKDADGHSFTIKTKNGNVHVVTTAGTKFFQGRKGKTAGSLADMKVGQRVIVVGEEDSSHNFDAARVRYWTPDPAKKPAAPKPGATS
jgi:hypothetical protein